MKNDHEASKPRFPKTPEDISLDQILPAIRSIARRKNHSHEYPGLEVEPGKKYVMVCDSTNDKMVMEALTLAIEEGGGFLETIIVHGYPGMTEPIDLVDTMFSRNWLPPWVWQATSEADVVIMNAFLLAGYTPNIPVNAKEKASIMMYLSADMCLPQFQNFPVELRDAIDEKTWKSLVYSKKIELTDLEGTDLKWSVTRQSWDIGIAKDQAKFGRSYHPGHLMVPLPSKDAEGELVTSSITFGGPVPRTTMTIRGGQVTCVDGEGKFADVLRDSFEEYKEIRSPRLPGPGINWWTTLGIGTSPKCRIGSCWDKMTGSGRMHAWSAGHNRSGIIHTSIGEGVVSHDHRIIRHVDLYFPTLVADGEIIIDKGHLASLNHPEIIKLATKYGDPSKVLREDWIPGISGINT